MFCFQLHVSLSLHLTYVCRNVCFTVFACNDSCTFRIKVAINLVSVDFFACIFQPSDLRKHLRKVHYLII